MNDEKAKPIVLRGVCYSPAPLNGSNAAAPNIGDWFWDEYEADGTTISGWDALWKRDLDNIRKLGANAIRIYCMLSRQLRWQDGKIPNPWNGGHLYTHQRFLDSCWNGGNNPLYVLVGIPLPANMFWKEQYDKTPKVEIEYWENVLVETAKMVIHPAVMGFTIQNEQDGADVCYNNEKLADFWWGQANKMAGLVKMKATSTKLVGMATHEDPRIPGKAAKWMAHCPNIDFWGVNSYQTVNFDPIFNRTPDGPGYSGLTGHALKPVILMEYGIPATGHKNSKDPSTIYEDEETRKKTAKVIGDVLPKAFQQPLCGGVYYFEYCDEWWNQPGSPNIYTWWGGAPAGFPNGFWDQDGFGLYSISRGKGLKNNDPIWDGPNNRPTMPIDVHTERKELTDTVRKTYTGISAIQAQVALVGTEA